MARATPPQRVSPKKTHSDYALWTHVKEAILSLPGYFSAPEIRVAGVRATEVFTLGAALGATIEDQVVVTLNRMRHVWDAQDAYPLLTFIRQPQTFPDVKLRDAASGAIKLGIELKGWYLLSKEGEPSFRYQVTPRVATVWDLLVVVPWFLSDVISGTPRVLRPHIESARYAAEYRNHWWRNVRDAKGSATAIRSPKGVGPYPQKSDHIVDHPVEDAGGNFGRIARIGLIDEYVDEMLDEQITGIPARYWHRFLSMFKEGADPADIARALERIERLVSGRRPDPTEIRARTILARLLELLQEGKA